MNEGESSFERERENSLNIIFSFCAISVCSVSVPDKEDF